MEQVLPFLLPIVFLTVGVILLVAGARLLKSAVGLGFGLLGAGIGLAIEPEISIGIPPWVIVLTFGIVAAILAVYLSKLAILISLALSFAIIAPTATWMVADLRDGKEVVKEIIEAAQETPPADQSSTSSFSKNQQTLFGPLQLVKNDISAISNAGWNRVVATVKPIPTSYRFLLGGAAVAGLLFGLLIATFLPYFSSAIVTSVGGSFILIEGIRTGVAAVLDPSQMPTIGTSLLIWSIVGIAAAGFGLQLTLTKPSKTPQPTS